VVGGTILQPTFAPTDAGTDWNDFTAQHGRAAVRQLIEAELRKQGLTLPAEMARPATATVTTQAMRDAARQSPAPSSPRQQARLPPRRLSASPNSRQLGQRSNSFPAKPALERAPLRLNVPDVMEQIV
jgi:hypothetical protein